MLAGIERGQRVLDVVCGSGATARLLARERGCDVVGLDLGSRAIAEAADAARAAGLAARVRFVLGDAEALPFPDTGFDVAVSECSLCTFPDTRRAIAELARVVRPGGTIAIADVTADLNALPAQLRSAAARVACVADARSAKEYASLVRDAGWEPVAIETHDDELRAMADRVEARLRVARMLASPGEQRDRAAEASSLARMAIEAIARGMLGYALITARRLHSRLELRGCRPGNEWRGSPKRQSEAEMPAGRTSSGSGSAAHRSRASSSDSASSGSSDANRAAVGERICAQLIQA
jgi:arsenite methyltransferase